MQLTTKKNQKQNWQHVQTIFSYLNKTPKESHDTDFARVRKWNLHEQGSFYRQNILLSSYFTPEMSSLFGNYCHNRRGLVRFESRYGFAEKGKKLSLPGHGGGVFCVERVPSILEIVPQVLFYLFIYLLWGRGGVSTFLFLGSNI